MELMSKHRVKWSTGPNFAYKLVARKMEEQLASGKTFNLDLSCIDHLSIGTEPIHTDTKAIFEGTFGQYGLRENWFIPVYGMAEYVVGGCWIRGLHLSDVSNDPSRPTQFVAVGSRDTFDESFFPKVVNPDTCLEEPDGRIGELWLAGPSKTRGYFGKPELSAEVFHAELLSNQQGDTPMQYLKTGDLAFFEKGRLFICGRIKDRYCPPFFVSGVNHYPQVCAVLVLKYNNRLVG